MAVLFKRKKKSENGSLAKEKIAKTIAFLIGKMQHAWVKYMEQLAARFSVKTKVTIFCAYLLLIAGLSGYSIIKSVFLKGDERAIAKPAKVQTAKLKPEPIVKLVMPIEIRQRINGFKQLLDSLNKTKAGQKTRDSILSSRPGLRDSVNSVLEIYQ